MSIDLIVPQLGAGKVQYDFNQDSTDLTPITKKVGGHARVFAIALKVPNFTNAVTVKFTVTDADGFQLFEQAAVPRNATTFLTAVINIPIAEDLECKITPSGAVGGAPGTNYPTIVKIWTY